MSERALPPKDFFFELMKDSQRLRAGYLAERERWLRSLTLEGREEILFEFEMLLRGIERYFNLHNLPVEESAAVVSRNFLEELKSVRDAMNRAVKLARFLVDPPSDRKLVFRKYLESRVADDRVRREMLEAELEQRTPQESLFLVRSGFMSLRGLLDHLQKLDFAGYQLFSDIGQLALRELALNKYFKPFRPLEFRQEYDRIKSVRILELLKEVDEGARKPLSIAFLALFRLVHYLRYVPGPAEPQLRRAQVVVALIHSEVATLSAFLEGDLAARLARLGPEKSAQALRTAQELKREAARIARRELAFTGTPPPEAMGSAREAFLALFQQAVASLARIFDPTLDQAALFDAASVRLEQSERLRLDLYAFRELCGWAAHPLAEADPARAAEALERLKAFVAYFRDVSYQLLRYGDYEPFDRFAAIVRETATLPAGPVQRQRLAADCTLFAEALEKTFAAVCRREILANRPFAASEARQLAERFIGVKA